MCRHLHNSFKSVNTPSALWHLHGTQLQSGAAALRARAHLPAFAGGDGLLAEDGTVVSGVAGCLAAEVAGRAPAGDMFIDCSVLGTGVSARAAKGAGGREHEGGTGGSKTWGIGDDRGRCMPIPGEAIIAASAPRFACKGVPPTVGTPLIRRHRTPGRPGEKSRRSGPVVEGPGPRAGGKSAAATASPTTATMMMRLWWLGSWSRLLSRNLTQRDGHCPAGAC